MHTRAGYGDWLGLPAERLPQFLPFEEARAFARTLGLQSQREWEDWCKQGERPYYIPADPRKLYEKTGEWAGAGQASECKCLRMRPRCTCSVYARRRETAVGPCGTTTTMQ